MKVNNLNYVKISYKGKVNKETPNKLDDSQNYINPTVDNLKAYYGRIVPGGIERVNKQKYIKLRDEFCKELEPRQLDANKKCWDFYINSSKENLVAYQKADDVYHDLFKNENLYNIFSDLSKKDLGDKHLNKQVKDLVRDFEDECNNGEMAKALRDKENEIAAKYNSYVPMIDGKEVSKTEITKILQNEKNPEIRKKAYEAKIKGGDLIANDLVEFTKLRNEYAKTKGYDNFFDYQLKEIYDVEPEQLNELLEDVYANAKHSNLKNQLENKQDLAKAFGITPKDLKAYHYGLLLENNPVKDVNKSIKDDEHVVEIAKKAYLGMGYDIDKMPITLDLFPRKNKNTHGFCFGIEAGKDARILANLTNDTSSIDTLCHELGHCVYDLGISTDLPYLDKDASSPAMTEAVAMMMGDLIQKENILKGVVSDDVLDRFKNDHKKSETKFINRSMQIINFEKEMYKNPDQDLGKLWHDMKCKYSGHEAGEDVDNEWATIPHYLSHPAYYQNYFRADLMKAQMYKHLVNELGPLSENKNTAKYLDENIFSYGKSIDENDLIEKITGEKLSSKALCENLK